MITNTPKLQTKRLILRKFNENDIEAFYQIFSDQEVNTYLPWFPLKSIAEAKLFMEERYFNVYKEKQGYMYAICLKSDNVPIGYVNVSNDDSHDFGYGLLKQYWHQGIVSEAGKAVIEQLKKDNVPYITATHDINNIYSGAVMKKMGMIYQYSYQELWQPKNKLITFRMYQLNLDGCQDRVYQKYCQMYPHFIEKEIV